MSTKKLQIIGSLSSDGVYVGSGDMPDGYNVQIDPTGDDTYSLLPAVTADDNGKVAIVQNGEWTAAVMDAQSDITIDSELSATSTNPVQNKVVKSAIDNISTLVGDSSVSEQISAAIVDKADSEHTHIAEDISYTQANEEWSNAKQALDGIYEYLSAYGDSIDELATNSHTHDNKNLLDKFGLNVRNMLTYNGNSIADAIEGIKASNVEYEEQDGETISVKDTLDGLYAGLQMILDTEATTSASGLMSAADKQKIDGIEDGANKIIVDSALSSTSTNPVQNKVINTEINNLNTLVGDTSVSSQITNAIDLLDLSNTYIAASQKGAASGVAELDSSGKVPSSQLNAVTKSDIGLSNVDNTSDASKPISTATQTALDNKVDKITGKSLSTNDYTTAEKTKLAGIEEGATKYTHPTGDGNLHVPATGTSNSGKVLKAGSTAGSISWGSLSKSDVGLGNVDNTSDANKPISTATQTALDAKQDSITGAATTITGSNLTASRALISNSSGKVAVSSVTSTELGYLSGVTSNIQAQFNNINIEDGTFKVSYADAYALDLSQGWIDIYLGNGSNAYANKALSILPTTINSDLDSPSTQYKYATFASEFQGFRFGSSDSNISSTIAGTFWQTDYMLVEANATRVRKQIIVNESGYSTGTDPSGTARYMGLVVPGTLGGMTRRASFGVSMVPGTSSPGATILLEQLSDGEYSVNAELGILSAAVGTSATIRMRSGTTNLPALTFNTSALYYDGKAVTTSSTERIKKDIEAVNFSASDKIRDAQIYSYHLKDEHTYDGQPDSITRYGLVVERECPDEVIDVGGDSINLYSMCSIGWKAIQEILTRLEKLEEK